MKSEDIDDKKLAEFLKAVYYQYGYDFINYNYSAVKRRIENHCARLDFSDVEKAKVFDEYCKMVLTKQKYFDDMFSYFSINVTEFFREPNQLKLFRQKVIPYLNSFSHIKIWCAGCSSGEAPYTLSIILDELGLLNKCQIYATDFNNRMLAHAKDGLFEIKDFKQSNINYEKSGGTKVFQNYFIKQGKYYKIKKYLKEKILFFNHNLVTDGVINEFQLIICKNVIIYFDKNLKDTVLNLFDTSLVCNGFLILGSSEYLPTKFEDKFELYIPYSKVYHKKCK